MTQSDIKEGIMLVDKPVGPSSFNVVYQVRRLSGVRKVGHAGTLDPQASGLMIVLVGKEWTKQAERFLKLDKTYQVEITLGQTSSTGDSEGQIVQVSDAKPTRAKITKTIEQFIGSIEQIPPAYSAIKIDGQRAYKIARKGEKVDIKPRIVTIHSIGKLKYNYPQIAFETRVSSGTYIRSLAADIGQALGTGAYMSALRRTQIGDYDLNQAVVLERLKQT